MRICTSHSLFFGYTLNLSHKTRVLSKELVLRPVPTASTYSATERILVRWILFPRSTGRSSFLGVPPIRITHLRYGMVTAPCSFASGLPRIKFPVLSRHAGTTCKPCKVGWFQPAAYSAWVLSPPRQGREKRKESEEKIGGIGICPLRLLFSHVITPVLFIYEQNQKIFSGYFPG